MAHHVPCDDSSVERVIEEAIEGQKIVKYPGLISNSRTYNEGSMDLEQDVVSSELYLPTTLDIRQMAEQLLGLKCWPAIWWLLLQPVSSRALVPSNRLMKKSSEQRRPLSRGSGQCRYYCD